MTADIRDFPWSELPRGNVRDGELVAALGSLAGAVGRRDVSVPGLGALSLSVGGASRMSRPQLAARLSDPTSAAVVIRAGALAAHVVVPGQLVRSLGQRLLGGPDELDAPRPSTPAERGALSYAAAAVASQLGPDIQVEPVETAGPLVAAERDAAVVIELAIEGAARGQLAVVLPVGAGLRRRHRSLASLVAQRGAWLDDPVEVPVVLARVALGADELGRLRRRDVLVVDRVGGADDAQLRVGRGWVAVRLASDGSRLTVNATYERGSFVDETLADDTAVEVSVAAGAVTLSVRRVLELAPGQVLALGRPVGGAVELRVGRRVIGRGELVDVDGELGVRVVAIDEPLVPPS